MLTLDEAHELLAGVVRPLPAIELPLEEAFGCRLAAAVAAGGELPPADVSAMDGYAARAFELAAGAPLPIAFVVPAGAAPPPLPPRTAARIFTGAMLPAGADTVVPQEEAEVRPGGAVRLAALARGANVRRRGEVLARGQAVAEICDIVSPPRVGVLAAAGVSRVAIVPRPRMALLLTGAELVASDTTPGPGQVRDSNRPVLLALAREAGLRVTRVVQVSDELPALREALAAAAARADLVLTSGGVSVGDFDLVPDAVRELGGEVVLHKVLIQPGKPVLVARLGGAWLVGLPGNPVSVLACWRLFARPLAEALAGDRSAFAERPVPAALLAPAHNPGERLQLRPARLEVGDRLGARVLSWKGSHDLVAAAPANLLVRLGPGASLPAGAEVGCYPLPWRWDV
jgi:molybdopterin molybdotransferase